MFNTNNPMQGGNIKEYYKNFYNQNKLIVILMAISLVAMLIAGDNFLHILYNVYLIYFGGFLLKQQLGEQKMLSTFILSATVGFGIFAINYSELIMTPISISSFIGAGAIGLLAAAATYLPNMEIVLVLFGKVKIKWVAIVLIGLDLMSIMTQGQEYRISNIGGAGFGYLSMMMMKQRAGAEFVNPLSGLFSKKPKFSSSVNDSYSKNTTQQQNDEQYNQQKKVEQQEIDVILEKVRQKGYEGLNKEEKQKLFDRSKEL
ncbi:MAG: hypothetical protein KAG84_00170 [Bacteroidales bacterium]|nr:hypothetical protein [Bacteroidales bacterium]